VKSLKRSPLVDLAVSQLTQQLEAGTWPIGSALPGEVRLAEELGVGRSTIREATRALVHAGLLEARQGSGTYVLATSAAPSLDSTLNNARVIEIYEVREALELQAATLAAVRRTEDDISAMRSALAARELHAAGQQADPATFVDIDFRFHRAIVVAAHNELLLTLFDSLAAAARDTLVTMVGEQLLAEVDVDTAHRALLDAVIDGDAAAAALAVSANIDPTIESAAAR